MTDSHASNRRRLSRAIGAFCLSLAGCLCTLWVCADTILGDAWRIFLINDILVPAGLHRSPVSQPVTVTVPDLTGQLYTADGCPDVTRDVYDVSVTYLYNDKQARTVLSQTPAAGLTRKAVPGELRIPLSLTVSVGPRLSIIPDVFGVDSRTACIDLTEKGLLVRTVDVYPVRPGVLADADGCTYRYVPRGTSQFVDVSTLTSGTALFSDPPDGSRLPAGTDVTLYVLSALPVPSPVCPQLVGLSYEDAVAALEERGITVGQITLADDDTAFGLLPGTVVNQSRLAGTRLSPYDKVDITIAPERALPFPFSDPRHFRQSRLPSKYDQKRNLHGLH